MSVQLGVVPRADHALPHYNYVHAPGNSLYYWVSNSEAHCSIVAVFHSVHTLSDIFSVILRRISLGSRDISLLRNGVLFSRVTLVYVWSWCESWAVHTPTSMPQVANSSPLVEGSLGIQSAKGPTEVEGLVWLIPSPPASVLGLSLNGDCLTTPANAAPT